MPGLNYDQQEFKGHVGFGVDGTPDMEIVAGYTPSKHPISASENFTGVTADALLVAGVAGRARYMRTASFGGDFAPSVYGVVGVAEWDPRTGTDGVNNNDAVGLFGNARVKSTATMPPYRIHGIEAGVILESGAPQMTTETAGLDAGVTMLGTTPTAPFSASIIASGIQGRINTGRTGTYKVASIKAAALQGAGIPTTLYGVYIEAHTQGSTESYNLMSLGTTSKNKFQGRVFMGTPATAPTDADIDNGMVTAYLNEGGNTLTFRVKYAAGTLKTGTVALI